MNGRIQFTPMNISFPLMCDFIGGLKNTYSHHKFPILLSSKDPLRKKTKPKNSVFENNYDVRGKILP